MMDNEFAELVGILLGDGSIGIYKSWPEGREKTQYRIKVTLNSEKDFQYAKHVAALFLSVFHKMPIIRKRKAEKALDIYILGKQSVYFLLRQGLALSPKWGRAIVPERFLRPPLDKLVLRGYMDTDGCVCAVNNNGIRYPRIEMKISPAPMQHQLIGILRRNGFVPQINRIERGKVRIALSGLKNLALWEKEIGFSNERNKLVALSFLKPQRHREKSGL